MAQIEALLLFVPLVVVVVVLVVLLQGSTLRLARCPMPQEGVRNERLGMAFADEQFGSEQPFGHLEGVLECCG